MQSRRDFIFGTGCAAASVAYSWSGTVDLRKELAQKNLAIARAGGTKLRILPFNAPSLERRFPLDPLGAIGQGVLDVSWASESRSVVFLTGGVSQKRRLWVIGPLGKPVWPAREMPLPSVAAPRLSPNGAQVAFLTRHESHFALWHLGPEGPPIEIARKRIDGDPRRVSATVGWNPGGDRNVVGWNGQIDICSVGQPGTTTIGAGVNPGWSPDGKWIEFREPDDHLVVVKSDGTGSPIFRSTRRITGRPSGIWSPGSEYILCNEEGSGHLGPTSNVVLYRIADRVLLALWDNLAIGIFDCGITANWQEWSMNLPRF